MKFTWGETRYSELGYPLALTRRLLKLSLQTVLPSRRLLPLNTKPLKWTLQASPRSPLRPYLLRVQKLSRPKAIRVPGPVILPKLQAKVNDLGVVLSRKLLRSPQWQHFALPCTQVPPVNRRLQSRFVASPRPLAKKAKPLATPATPPPILPPQANNLQLVSTHGLRTRPLPLLPFVTTLTKGKGEEPALCTLLTPAQANSNRPETPLAKWSPKLAV